MNNLPAHRENFGISHSNTFMLSMEELEKLNALCHTLAKAPFYQKLGPGGVLAIWLTAKELKLPPMMCLNGGLHNIEGKVSMSSQLMNMMIINAGHEIDVLYLNEQGCSIRFTRVKRNGQRKSDEYEFNMKDAQRAKYFGEPGPNGTWISKPKNNWTMYPRDMFFARALSGGAKKFLPEVMMNCYVFGELEDAEVTDIQSSHEFIENITPLEDRKVSKQVDHTPNADEKLVMIEQFKIDHDYENNVDLKEYISEFSNRYNKTEDFVINSAINTPEKFSSSFTKWKESRSTESV